MIRPCKPTWIERKKKRDLKQQFEEFWERKNLQRVAGRFSAPPPFVGFSATQNCSDWCLSLVFFPFNRFWLAGANQKITFWGPGTYFAKYITWGPKFFCCSKMAVTRRRKHLFNNKNTSKERSTSAIFLADQNVK